MNTVGVVLLFIGVNLVVGVICYDLGFKAGAIEWGANKKWK